jgi:hypothetical protein
MVQPYIPTSNYYKASLLHREAQKTILTLKVRDDYSKHHPPSPCQGSPRRPHH